MTGLLDEGRFVKRALEHVSDEEWKAMPLIERSILIGDALDAWNEYVNVRGYERWQDEKGTWHVRRLTSRERGLLRRAGAGIL